MTARSYESYEIEWSGIRIAVRFCPRWLEFYERVYGYPLAHLEIESVEPARAPLPMTKTGYRSHFTRADMIEAHGGPAAFVRAWLAEAVKDPEWMASVESWNQLSLF
jgi:hypothetical protein